MVGLLVVDIVLVAVLVSWLGAPGAALATLSAMALMLVAGMVMTTRYLQMTVFSAAWARGLAGGVFAWGAVELLVRFGPLDGGVRLVVACIVALAVFAGAMKLLGLDADDEQMLRSMIRRRQRDTKLQ